ncbi:MAG TPA: hypothetical protein VFO16_17105 [Pseudonocardiaceae bacterium]|nr:hypothetical protein [Pseudonocardiaceae bacterium]
MRAVVFDNEAVQALSDPDHDKHRVVVAHLAAVVTRRRKGALVLAVVPTAVRVEAGWDRSDARAAAINRFRVVDHNLDTAVADTAARVARRTGASVADAHVGAVVRHLPLDDVVVLTSDPDDMARVSAPKAITAIRI